MHTTNVVLVHGAWTDGSSWNGVIERLQKAGYTVTSVQLPLTSLTEDKEAVHRVLSAQTKPTVLVAHAFGGAVVTALGKDTPSVVSLMYLSAFVPDEGETMKLLITRGRQPAGGAAIRPDAFGFIWLDRAGFVRYVAPDVDTDQAQALAAVQKPIAVTSFLGEEVFGEPAWKFLPTWYLVAEQDQMILPEHQHFMARRAGATISSIAASHVSMISQPDEVTRLIIAVTTAA